MHFVSYFGKQSSLFNAEIPCGILAPVLGCVRTREGLANTV